MKRLALRRHCAMSCASSHSIPLWNTWLKRIHIATIWRSVIPRTSQRLAATATLYVSLIICRSWPLIADAPDRMALTRSSIEDDERNDRHLYRFFSLPMAVELHKYYFRYIWPASFWYICILCVSRVLMYLDFAYQVHDFALPSAKYLFPGTWSVFPDT